MINYNWIISAMDTALLEDGLTDVVKVVHWRRQASQELEQKFYSVDTFGAIECSPPDPMAFTPYNQLTFDQVCSWLESKLDVNAMDTILGIQLENKIHPVVVQIDLPWLNN